MENSLANHEGVKRSSSIPPRTNNLHPNHVPRNSDPDGGPSRMFQRTRQGLAFPLKNTNRRVRLITKFQKVGKWKGRFNFHGTPRNVQMASWLAMRRPGFVWINCPVIGGVDVHPSCKSKACIIERWRKPYHQENVETTSKELNFYS